MDIGSILKGVITYVVYGIEFLLTVGVIAFACWQLKFHPDNAVKVDEEKEQNTEVKAND